MRVNGFVSGLCLTALIWTAPGLQADAGLPPDWRPLPQAFGAMPRALGQFRPQQRVAAPPRPAYVGTPAGTPAVYPGSGRYPAMPAYAPMNRYPAAPYAWAQSYQPAPYAPPVPNYGGWPQQQAGYGVPPRMGGVVLPRRVTWNQPAMARFRPVADPRTWAQPPSWRAPAAPAYQQAVRYPGRMGGMPAVRVAPSPRPGAWQGKTVFRPVPGSQLPPQYAARSWSDPRFRPLPAQYRERRMAQEWRPADNANLPGWLSTESGASAWQACGFCTGS